MAVAQLLVVRHLGDMLKSIQSWFRRRRFREGRTLSRFIARDVRRDVQIVSAARIDEGFITVRVRTLNVLYVSKGLTAKPEFESPREMRLDEIGSGPARVGADCQMGHLLWSI